MCSMGELSLNGTLRLFSNGIKVEVRPYEKGDETNGLRATAVDTKQLTEATSAAMAALPELFSVTVERTNQTSHALDLVADTLEMLEGDEAFRSRAQMAAAEVRHFRERAGLPAGIVSFQHQGVTFIVSGLVGSVLVTAETEPPFKNIEYSLIVSGLTLLAAMDKHHKRTFPFDGILYVLNYETGVEASEGRTTDRIRQRVTDAYYAVPIF